MAYILRKRGRYYAGHSYCNVPGFGRSGYRFSWTADENRAHRFQDDEEGEAARRAAQTGAKIIPVPNTKAEIRQLARRCKGRLSWVRWTEEGRG